jgi:hypothetical protein
LVSEARRIALQRFAGDAPIAENTNNASWTAERKTRNPDRAFLVAIASFHAQLATCAVGLRVLAA